MRILILLLFPLSLFGQDSLILKDCAFRSIVKDSIYHIFEEKYDGKIWRIYTRTSKDGIHFTNRSEPLFEPGEPGRFDEMGQADPTVVKDSIWRMWYDAINLNGIWDSLGYAISHDGLNWVKQGTVLGRTKQGDSKSIHHPVVIKYNEIFYMFYSGSATGDEHIVKNIFLAISFDGVHFIKREESILKAGMSDFDAHYVRPSRPYNINGLWYMNYWAYDGDNRRIMIATSRDLINWNREGILINNGNPTASDVLVMTDGIVYFANIWYTVFISPSGNLLYYRFEKY